jgi:plasmid stabilization system protein ParE
VKFHWTAAAEAHLDAIYGYVAQDSGTYALRMLDRITKRSEQIGHSRCRVRSCRKRPALFLLDCAPFDAPT